MEKHKAQFKGFFLFQMIISFVMRKEELWV